MINSPKVKKIIVVVILILFIIIDIFAYPIYKSLYTAISGDIIIYKHESSKFLFSVSDISDDNQLELKIHYHQGKGLLGTLDPFYHGEHLRKSVTEYVNLPKEYDITPKNCLRDEKGVIQTDLFESQLSDYGLSKFQVDFRVDGGYCNPELLELNDGRQFVVYKKFNYLFLHNVDKN